MSKIFVTGAGSFLGKGLVDKLKTSNEVIVLEHEKFLNINALKKIQGGMENVETWSENLAWIDVIIHMAGVTHSMESLKYFLVNTEGTKNLAEAAKKYGVKQFIFISTSAIEEDCGAYGESKKEAEKILKESGLAYTILRVGPSYDNDFSGKEGVASLIELARKSFVLPYLSNTDIRFSPIHQNDVLDSIVSAIGNQKTYFNIYTVSGPENLSTKEIFSRLLKHKKIRKLLIPVPTFLVKIAFYIFSNILKKIPPDQLQRSLSKKQPLSENVLTDLGINPRKFLQP